MLSLSRKEKEAEADFAQIIIVAVDISSGIEPDLRLKYQSFEIKGVDIHVCSLKNSQQFSDKDGEAEEMGISSALWPLFGTVWDSSIVLAHYVSTMDVKNKKVLEIGCGLALSSHFLNAIEADITATDYHPEVKKFLDENSRINNTRLIPFERIDWTNLKSGIGCYNIIIGSDVLYMDNHPKELASFINQHADSNSVVVIVDPGRNQINRFTKAMHLFEFAHKAIRPEAIEGLSKPFTGQVHCYSRF